MGYAHYWTQPKKLPPRKFKAASDDCRRVCDDLVRNQGLVIQLDFGIDESPDFTGNDVRFNGRREDGHAIFHIRRESQYGWAVCTTAHKPYDLAVCCCLIVFRAHIGERFVVTSDGDDDKENWPRARQLCQVALGYGHDFVLKSRDDFGRMGVNGIPVTRHSRSLNGSERRVYVLANGWAMRSCTKRPFGRLSTLPVPLRHRVAVYEDEHSATHGKPDRVVMTAPNLATARWDATFIYLERRFCHLPKFMNVFRKFQKTFDWSVLAAYANRLEEFNESHAAKKLRALLPRRVWRAKRASHSKHRTA